MDQQRAALIKRALFLEWVTIGYNIVEAIIAIGAGAAADSIALISFGMDSCIEVTAAFAVVHRFRTHDPDKQDAAERRALRVVGATFVFLAIYVLIESIRKLWIREVPGETMVGIILTAISALWMPYLSRSKRLVAEGLNSRALLADSRETLFCAILSVVVLAGLGANTLFGWWWADPVAGLVVVYFLIKEAREAWQGHEDHDKSGD